MKKIISTILSAAAIISAASCSDILETAPANQVASGNMWTSPALAAKGMNGLYQAFYNTLQGNGTQLRWENLDGFNKYGMEALGFCTDYYSNNYPVQMLYYSNKRANDLQIRWEWKMNYTIVHAANDAIANLYKAGLDDATLDQYLCEARFLRAWAYYRLNCFFMGVPIYLEPVTNEECTRIQSTPDEVWQVVLDDLDYCINSENMPDNTLTTTYGRPSKGAAYALRGKTWLWKGFDRGTQNPYIGMAVSPKSDSEKKTFFENAVADFEKVPACGYGFWNGEYADLFLPENERDAEMIFTIQYDVEPGYCDNIQQALGGRDTYDGWTEVKPSADFVNYYQNADGSTFSFESMADFTDYAKMNAKQRAVFFCRDGLKSNKNYASQKSQAIAVCGQAIFDKYYLDSGNEARLKKAFDNRDPRLKQTIITPYEPIDCYKVNYNGDEQQKGKQLRWPLYQQGTDGGDFWLDKRTSAFYCYKKYVRFQKGDLIDRQHCYTDFPLIRYTDVLLNRAEALIELDRFSEAKTIIDKVRARAHMPVITVGDKEQMREAVRYERRVEFPIEAVNFLDEMRWGTYKQTKFQGKDVHGGQSWWGDDTVEYSWYYDAEIWPFTTPLFAYQRNPEMLIRDGWVY